MDRGVHQYTLASAMQNGLPGFSNTATGTAFQDAVSTANPSATNFEYNTPFTVAIALRRKAVSSTNAEWILGNYEYQSPAGGAPTGWTGRGWALTAGNNSAGFSLKLFHNSGAQSPCAARQANLALVDGNNYIVQMSSDGTGTAAGITARINGAAVTSYTTILDNLGTNTIVPGSYTNTNFNGGFSIEGLSGVNTIGGGGNGGTANGSAHDSIFEVVIVNRLLTIAEQTMLDAYMNSRWAIY